MAMTVHLELEAAGNKIEGESSIASLGREGTIECLQFEDAVRTARDKATGMATGERTYDPIRIVKRIDKASPLLAKALVNNEEVNGAFKFYRPSPSGDGTTQHFFTVEIEQARVSEIHRTSPDVVDPAAAPTPPTEQVGFVFGKIMWRYEDGGVSHADEWSQRV